MSPLMIICLIKLFNLYLLCSYLIHFGIKVKKTLQQYIAHNNTIKQNTEVVNFFLEFT